MDPPPNSNDTLPLSGFNYTPIAQNSAANYVEFAIRGYDFLMHLIYFLYVLLKRNTELRTRTYLHQHNINVATMLISLMYLAYTPNSVPMFSSQYTNMVLCTMTEYAWSFLKYARVLSLLLIAIYRYIGCFYTRSYKNLNSKLSYLLGSIALCWLSSIIPPIIFKFALSTSYSIYFCTDGFSLGRMNYSIAYYVVNTTLSMILPTIAIFVIYVRIYYKLKDQASKTNTNVDTSSKLARFSRQFVVFTVLTSIASVFATFVDFVNVIAVKF